jgi:hypothetical protein
MLLTVRAAKWYYDSENDGSVSPCREISRDIEPCLLVFTGNPEEHRGH